MFIFLQYFDHNEWMTDIRLSVFHHVCSLLRNKIKKKTVKQKPINLFYKYIIKKQAEQNLTPLN